MGKKVILGFIRWSNVNKREEMRREINLLRCVCNKCFRIYLCIIVFLIMVIMVKNNLFKSKLF